MFKRNRKPQALPPIDHAAMPTLSDIPAYFAKRQPSAIATTFAARNTDWATLHQRANQIASALAQQGVRPGDRVAFVGKGSDEFFEILFGAARAGAVLCPIIWRLAAPEIINITRDCGARVLFVAPDQFDRVETFRAELPDTKLIGLEHGGDLTQFSVWRDLAPSKDTPTTVVPGDVALQLYTSGTTGLPKGVMLTHGNLLRGRAEAAATKMPWNEWESNDVNLVPLPMGHIGGVGWAIVGYFNGARTVVQPEFIPDAVLNAIEHEGVTKLFVVPTALHMLLLHPRVRQIDYSKLRHILYGASPIALDLLREATEVFGCGFCQQYGATETCGTIVYLPPEDHDPAGNKRMRGAGLPMPGVELKIVDRDGASLPPDEVGEIVTRSAANMAGYWKQAAQTSDVLDADGWFRTGDAGYLDADGYLYIADRFKDMICTGAENVYPNEVENAIFGHPAVQEVSVIGVPDERWGEAVKAIVVLKPGAAAAEADIIAFARTRIGGFKVPKSVDFIDALPRNPSGKILRRALRDPYWEGRERQIN